MVGEYPSRNSPANVSDTDLSIILWIFDITRAKMQEFVSMCYCVTLKKGHRDLDEQFQGGIKLEF